MRAVVCGELTGVGGLEYVSDWPEPQAGPGEVVVEVKAAALNFPDLLMIQGLYQERPPLPFVVGTEMSGVVTAVGAGVQHLSVGDRVVSACGRTLAERVVAKAGLVIPAPRALDFPSAAGICITYFTTMHAYRQRAQLRPGEPVLVRGAAGGVGTTAVELGKQFGATVIAAAGSDAKLELARRLGADHVINYSTQDLRERVKDITGGKGVDVVYDPVGGALAEPALRSMAWNGRYLVIGFAGGDIPKIPLNLPLLMERSIVGVYWGEWSRRTPQEFAAAVRELSGWFREGRLKPHVTATYPLFSVHEFAHAWTANYFGDDTPGINGRLTLNPLAYLDILGSIMLLIAGFGWAKPVPVNPYILKRRSSAALMWVSLARPMSNFFMALLAAIPFRLNFVTAQQAITVAYYGTQILPTLPQFLWEFITINLILMLFNLIPLAPLDGEKILDFVLAPSLRNGFEAIRPYGPFIL